MDKFILPEFEDYCFMDWLHRDTTGFAYKIFVTMDDGINKTPYIFCEREDPIFSDAIVVSISDNPEVLQGEFASTDEQEEIFDFVKENKETILEYWNKELSSFSFFDKVLIRGSHI